MNGPHSDKAPERESNRFIWEGKINVDVIAAGLTEFYKERNFEADSETVARIYLAMKAAELQPRK